MPSDGYPHGLGISTSNSRIGRQEWYHSDDFGLRWAIISVAPVAYQVILESGIGQFREFEPRRVHTRVYSLGLFFVHKLTYGKRESVS